MNKRNAIICIKDIIKKYGETTSIYLKLKIEDKPCLSLIVKGKEIKCIFVELYNKDSVTAITNINGYFKESNIIPYENIPEPILNQILKLLKHYEKRKVGNKYFDIL